MYQFTTAHPPTFEHHKGDVVNFPEEERSLEVGRASWNASTYRARTGVFGNIVQLEDLSSYQATRTLIWAPGTPRRFADRQELIVRETKGYTKTKATAFERSTRLELSAGIKDAFSASVQESLKLTQSVSEQWHEEVVTTITRTFEAGFSYVSWQLVDVIDVVRKSKTRVIVNNVPKSGWRNHRSAAATILSHLADFEDKFIVDMSGAVRPQGLGGENTFALSSTNVAGVRDGASTFYFAACDEAHGITVGWMGPERDTWEEAERDGVSHEAAFPGHECAVVDF